MLSNSNKLSDTLKYSIFSPGADKENKISKLEQDLYRLTLVSQLSDESYKVFLADLNEVCIRVAWGIYPMPSLGDDVDLIIKIPVSKFPLVKLNELIVRQNDLNKEECKSDTYSA